MDAPVIYIGAFPILTARPGRRSIYNTLKLFGVHVGIEYLTVRNEHLLNDSLMILPDAKHHLPFETNITKLLIHPTKTLKSI